MSLQWVLMVGSDVPVESDAAEEPILAAILEEPGISVQYHPSLEGLSNVFHDSLPDLVLLHERVLHNQSMDFRSLCQTIRGWASDYRPVIIVQSESEKEDERIHYLMHGADDVLHTQQSVTERVARLLAHLRRNAEALCHPDTLLPGLNLCARDLQRRMNLGESWGLLMIDIHHLDAYTEVYGSIPTQQVIMTFRALLLSVARANDMVGHTDPHTFILVTKADKAVKLAALLARRFDHIAPTFYSEKDQKRGYLVSVVGSHRGQRVSKRVGLLALSIGVVTSQSQPLDHYHAAIAAAMDLKSMAVPAEGSSWVSDHIKLTGEPCGSGLSKDLPVQSRILVIESDAALAFLLKTTLEMQGYVVDTVSTSQDALGLMDLHAVHLVLMDALINDEETGWELCRVLKARCAALRIVFTSTVHNREKALDAGADLYLPKPFELVTLFLWIERLLKH